MGRYVTVNLRPEVFERLKRLGRFGETASDVIARIIEGYEKSAKK